MWQSSGREGWLQQGLWWVEEKMRHTQMVSKAMVREWSVWPAPVPRQPATSSPSQMESPHSCQDPGRSCSWSPLRYLLSVQWVPPQPGQQALTVRFHVAGRVSGGLHPSSTGRQRDVLVFSPVPQWGKGWDFCSGHFLKVLSHFPLLALISPSAK
jgi:hypothetical protein